jgi:hypothetical protein
MLPASPAASLLAMPSAAQPSAGDIGTVSSGHSGSDRVAARTVKAAASARTGTASVTTMSGATHVDADTLRAIRVGGRLSSTASHWDTSPAQKLPGEKLDAILDGLRSSGNFLFGKYALLSSAKRRGGGQGRVQFVANATTAMHYAVKFFFNAEAFERERMLYNDPVLRGMMPATHEMCDNADGRHADAGGHCFPPFIVIERGEPLNEWSSRMRTAAGDGQLEMVSVFQTLCNVSRRLLMLHDAGYVHRDLKPSNLLWLPRLHAWTLIDFGSTARAGVQGDMLFAFELHAPST